MESQMPQKPRNTAAWAIKPNTRPLVVESSPYDLPPSGHVLIKVSCIAVNPIDWILQESDFFNLTYPTILGLDVAGEIVEKGQDVDGLEPGQRVIAHCNGYSADDPSHGAFQKYAVVPKAAVCELPSNIEFKKGVVLPLGISTAAAGLYQESFLALPFPSEDPKPLNRTILIWGGSSSVGSCAIQLARASGAEVFTTASPSNFEYCEELGAAKCFDYHNKDVEDEIVEALKRKTFAGAYHAVGANGAVEACARIADRVEGKALVVTVRGAPEEGIPKSVRVKSISSSTIFTNNVGPTIWRKFLPKALETGTLQPEPRALVVGKGLESVQEGLDRQKAGVSAAKVVVTHIS